MASGLQPLAVINLCRRLMDLVYTFDPERFYLGKPCKAEHCWPDSALSIRSIKHHYCVGCRGRKKADWLVSFIDTAAMGLAKGETLGAVCKGGHLWHGHELTLRVKGKCPECERIRKRTLTPKQREARNAKQRARYAQAYNPSAQKAKHEAIKARMVSDPEFAEYIRQQRRIYKERARRRAGMKQLPPVEIRQLHKAISEAGRLPSVARLVAMEQWRYWRENPETKRQAKVEQKKHQWRFKYLTNLDLRLYTREKARRRKIRERKQATWKISVLQLRARFSRFNHCCAYCGASGDMQIEHVKPISQGGLHHISNIVPACLSCNYAKHTDPMEQWYRSQPFFDPARLALIQSLTGSPETEQLSLGLAC
jgi:5-methylcytosine-specific restriction endonuclease McrA